MAMRSVWKGAVSCSLLNFPAKLYGATDEKGVKFNQIHQECGARISMVKRCSKCGQDLDAASIVKGYDLGDETFVTFNDSELASLKLNTLSAIEVLEFIPDGNLDLRLPKKAYFLAPDKGGGKAFALIAEAMSVAGVVAVVRFAMREKEQLGLMQPFQEGVMLLQALYWNDELRPWGELIGERYDIADAELELAGTLIARMSGEGEFSKYTDRYRKALEEAIETKVAGGTIAAPEATPVASSDNLMEMLQASVAEAK